MQKNQTKINLVRTSMSAWMSTRINHVSAKKVTAFFYLHGGWAFLFVFLLLLFSRILQTVQTANQSSINTKHVDRCTKLCKDSNPCKEIFSCIRKLDKKSSNNQHIFHFTAINVFIVMDLWGCSQEKVQRCSTQTLTVLITSPVVQRKASKT